LLSVDFNIWEVNGVIYYRMKIDKNERGKGMRWLGGFIILIVLLLIILVSCKSSSNQNMVEYRQEVSQSEIPAFSISANEVVSVTTHMLDSDDIAGETHEENNIKKIMNILNHNHAMDPDDSPPADFYREVRIKKIDGSYIVLNFGGGGAFFKEEDSGFFYVLSSKENYKSLNSLIDYIEGED